MAKIKDNTINPELTADEIQQLMNEIAADPTQRDYFFELKARRNELRELLLKQPAEVETE